MTERKHLKEANEADDNNSSNGVSENMLKEALNSTRPAASRSPTEDKPENLPALTLEGSVSAVLCSKADSVGEKSIMNDVDLIRYQFNPVAIPLPTEEDTLAVLRTKTQDELLQMNDIYKEKYGISLRDEVNVRMTPESSRRANAMFAGEADPGYLSPTNEDAQSALTVFNNSPGGGKTLDYYIDAEQLKAIQKNEVAKRGIEDDWQDYWNTAGSTKGPAQISDALVKELSEDSKYKDALSGVDPNTVSGAQEFMAAHMSQWVDRLNQGYFKTRAAEKLREAEQPDQTDAARNKLREDAAWMDAQQERWNTAVANGDRETTRKMLARRWNPGHVEQEEEVEAQRNAMPTDSRYARMYSTLRKIV